MTRGNDVLTVQDLVFTDAERYGKSIELCYVTALRDMARQHINLLLQAQGEQMDALRSKRIELEALQADEFSQNKSVLETQFMKDLHLLETSVEAHLATIHAIKLLFNVV